MAKMQAVSFKLNGKTVDEVTATWMGANEARWKPWIGK